MITMNILSLLEVHDFREMALIFRFNRTDNVTPSVLKSLCQKLVILASFFISFHLPTSEVYVTPSIMKVHVTTPSILTSLYQE